MGIKITKFDFNRIINQFAREARVGIDQNLTDDEFLLMVVSWFNEKYNGDLEYISSYSSIYFQNEEDATLFLLRNSK